MYKYNLETKKLDEQPEREYPTINGGVASNEMLEEYHKYIVSLNHYPVSETQDELWNEVAKIILHCDAPQTRLSEHDINRLQHFTITRKTN